MFWCRRIALVLEWSCHGLPWIFSVSLWLLVALLNSVEILPFRPNQPLWDLSFQFNRHFISSDHRKIANLMCMLAALLLDLVFVGMMKCVTRRHRPPQNKHEDMRLTFDIDKWSFPSGHASRASLLSWLIPSLWTVSWLQRTGLLIWCLVICYSRYAMRRHHMTDILAGYFMGLLEFLFIICFNWSFLSVLLVNSVLLRS